MISTEQYTSDEIEKGSKVLDFHGILWGVVKTNINRQWYNLHWGWINLYKRVHIKYQCGTYLKVQLRSWSPSQDKHGVLPVLEFQLRKGWPLTKTSLKIVNVSLLFGSYVPVCKYLTMINWMAYSTECVLTYNTQLKLFLHLQHWCVLFLHSSNMVMTLDRPEASVFTQSK